AVVCLRIYHEGGSAGGNWSARDPREVAAQANALARQFLAPTDFVTPANEMNLPVETAGRQASYEEIREWSARFAEGWDRLGHYSGPVSPALSPGHSEDQNDWGTPANPIIGYQILQPAWSRYDVIGAHCYWLGLGSGTGRLDAGLVDDSGPFDNHFYAF